MFYSCQQCEHKVAQKGNSKAHEESHHEGEFYSCSHCGNESRWKTSLKIHIWLVHEGFYHSCNHREHKQSQKRSLKRPLLSKHCCRCSRKEQAPSPTVSGSPLTETRWLPESSAAILKEKTGGGIMKRRCIFFVSLFTKRQAHFWWDSRCPEGMA